MVLPPQRRCPLQRGILNRLVRDGLAHKIDGTRGGARGTTAARYFAIDRRDALL